MAKTKPVIKETRGIDAVAEYIREQYKDRLAKIYGKSVLDDPKPDDPKPDDPKPDDPKPDDPKPDDPKPDDPEPDDDLMM